MNPLVISREPVTAEELNNFSAVINVADTPCRLFESPVPYFWFPIYEMGHWGYGPFLGALKVVERFRMPGNKPILIHCHAGVCRSASVAYAIVTALRQCNVAQDYFWYGHIFGKDVPKDEKHAEEAFKKKHIDGFIPHDIISFLVAAITHPNHALGSLIFFGADSYVRNLPEEYKKNHPQVIK